MTRTVFRGGLVFDGTGSDPKASGWPVCSRPLGLRRWVRGLPPP